jgi:hypothetical protein
MTRDPNTRDSSMIAQENRNWIKEAESYLYQQYSQLKNVTVRGATLTIKPTLDESEAKYFIRGLEERLFSVDEEGYVQSTLLGLPLVTNTRQKVLQLFWATKGGTKLFREGVCQLATVASLILKYGWLSRQIVMEPSKAEVGHLAYGVDILIRDEERSITICGEVKKDRSELHKLVEGFRDCCRRGPHTKDQCKLAKNHRKYEFCYALKPAYFFATAPGEEICFRLDGLCIQEEHRCLVYNQPGTEFRPRLDLVPTRL